MQQSFYFISPNLLSSPRFTSSPLFSLCNWSIWHNRTYFSNTKYCVFNSLSNGFISYLYRSIVYFKLAISLCSLDISLVFASTSDETEDVPHLLLMFESSMESSAALRLGMEISSNNISSFPSAKLSTFWISLRYLFSDWFINPHCRISPTLFIFCWQLSTSDFRLSQRIFSTMFSPFTLIFLATTVSNLLLQTPNLMLFRVSFKQLEWLEQVMIRLRQPERKSWSTWVSLDSRQGIYPCFFARALIVLVRQERERLIFFVSLILVGWDLSILSLPAKSTRLNFDVVTFSPSCCSKQIVNTTCDLDEVSFSVVALIFFISWHLPSTPHNSSRLFTSSTLGDNFLIFTSGLRRSNSCSLQIYNPEQYNLPFFPSLLKISSPAIGMIPFR